MSDNRLERERLQAEALKANLRRRKSQARAQKLVGEGTAEPPQKPADPGEPPA